MKLFLILLLCANIFAKFIEVLPLSNKRINYKQKIYAYDTRLIQANNKYHCKEYLDITTLKENRYRAKHFIAKNKPICKKDVYIAVSHKIRFRFGNLEIEREGDIIRETDQYIKIKTPDGKIEKIYKNGLQR